MIELTPDDYARCWPETRHLVDQFLDWDGVREVTAAEARWCLEDAAKWCGHFVMQVLPGWGNINASAYDLWNTDSRTVPATLEDFERAWRLARHRDCPLYKCEERDSKQMSVPVASPALMYMGMPVVVDLGLGDDEAYMIVGDESAEWAEWGDFYGQPPRSGPRRAREGTGIPRGLDAAAKRQVPPGVAPKVPDFLAKRNVRLDGRRR